MAARILQERTLSIDQRLAVLGIFLEQLDELIRLEKYGEIRTLTKKFTVKSTIYETVQNVWRDTNFKLHDFIKTMWDGVLKRLYENSTRFSVEAKIWATFKKNFNLNIESDGVSVAEMTTKNFMELEGLREKFSARYATIFENYLVNEFFLKCYPYRLKKSIAHNFGVFVAAYKIIEWFTFLITTTLPNKGELTIVKFIAYFSTFIDHNSDYLKKISTELDGKDSTAEIIATFLQTRNI